MTRTNQGDERLLAIVRERCEQSEDRALSFYEFMKLCLYHSEHGYYMRNKMKIGREGDFYTSSSIGTIMGELIAHFIAQWDKEQDVPADQQLHVVEWGAGNGQLSKQVLDEWKENFPDVYERIQLTSIEQSTYHQKLQGEAWKEHQQRVRWLSAKEWFKQGERRHTFIYSNELLDAFPVHRIQRHSGQMHEIFVRWNKEMDQIEEALLPLRNEDVLQYIEQEQINLLEGQVAEINLEANRFIRSIGEWLEQGALLTIDYGAEADEIYAAHRMKGTLMCYRKHQAHDNPYIHLGDQDITSHVNFSACIHAGLNVGLRDWKLIDQKTFLMEAGILNKLQNHSHSDPFHPIARKNRAIRQLLLSDQMSELFKVLVQQK